jgi:hypothetical protein
MRAFCIHCVTEKLLHEEPPWERHLKKIPLDGVADLELDGREGGYLFAVSLQDCGDKFRYGRFSFCTGYRNNEYVFGRMLIYDASEVGKKEVVWRAQLLQKRGRDESFNPVKQGVHTQSIPHKYFPLIGLFIHVVTKKAQ